MFYCVQDLLQNFNIMCICTIMFNYIVAASVWRRSLVVSKRVGLDQPVALRRARLVPGWVTICGRVNHLSM